MAGHSAKDRFGFSELIIAKARDRRAHGLGLQSGDFEGLAVRFRLATRREILAYAFTSDVTVDLENDFPGGIRFSETENGLDFMTDLACQRPNRLSELEGALPRNYLHGVPTGIRTPVLTVKG